MHNRNHTIFIQKPLLLFTLFLICSLAAYVPHAQASDPSPCTIDDRPCILSQLEQSAGAIENIKWRDQTYRELAKTLAFDGEVTRAIALINKIQSPDTKAMTIRGIGMALSDNSTSQEAQRDIFAALHKEAKKIVHPASFSIALTYIAMAQAFAGDNEGAWETAKAMENDGLRHKAYGETAEIQAERGDFNAAMTSISYIESESFQNKAYSVTSKILADYGLLGEALEMANKITNAYKQAGVIQYILDVQTPRDVAKK